MGVAYTKPCDSWGMNPWYDVGAHIILHLHCFCFDVYHQTELTV